MAYQYINEYGRFPLVSSTYTMDVGRMMNKLGNPDSYLWTGIPYRVRIGTRRRLDGGGMILSLSADVNIDITVRYEVQVRNGGENLYVKTGDFYTVSPWYYVDLKAGQSKTIIGANIDRWKDCRLLVLVYVNGQAVHSSNNSQYTRYF